MNCNDRPWRKIVRRDTRTEERASHSRRTFSWWATEVHTLTLECGHTQVRRGDRYSVPKKKVICKCCERGEAPVPVTVDPGVFEEPTPRMPRHPFARALLENAIADARSEKDEARS